MRKPKIHVLSTDTNVPCGGIKQLYRHVDILNAHGFDASIVHCQKGFRCTWFENKTPVSYLQKAQIDKSDYLVLPEIFGELFCKGKVTGGANQQLKAFIEQSKNRVIFNQNCYLSFNGYSIAEGEKNPFWLAESLITVIVVSEDSRRYMNYVFPDIQILRIHNSIDPNLFSYQNEKKKQICFMTRKLPDDVSQVINLLKYRNVLNGFKLIPIENRAEHDVAQIMKESFLFLSFSYQEGCPLPPQEAMMCGCLVAGYDGRGGCEYFSPEYSYPIQEGHVLNFAQTVEDVIGQYNANPAAFDEKRKKAAEFIRKTYSSEIEQDEILSCWRQIIALSGRRG
jgi:glycosyltransferase involved in cell wall biosynthesis